MLENKTIAEIDPKVLDQIVDHLKSWDWIRVVHLVVLVLSQTLGNALLCGIAWYELWGGMDQYKTVLNQLTAHFIVVMIGGKC